MKDECKDASIYRQIGLVLLDDLTAITSILRLALAASLGQIAGIDTLIKMSFVLI